MEIKRIILLILGVIFVFATPCLATEYGYSVRVGIIDSGIDKEKVSIVGGYNFLEETEDVTDNKGHGTKIAEIILSQVPKAELIALKCTEKDVNNDNSAIINAIYKAVDEFNCDVLNISIGMPGTDELKKAVDYATSKGCIIVSAVGNDGEISYKKGKIYYPAGYENVVGVGATDNENKVCEYSQKNNSVFVTTKSTDGTSFAAAQISAAAAIAKQFDKRFTYASFMDILKKSSNDLGETGFDTSYGHGQFDFNAFEGLLKERYTLLATEKEGDMVLIQNLSESEVSAKVVYRSDQIKTEEIVFLPNTKTQIDIENNKNCFIWQKSIYDIVWIKRGEL